MTEQELMAFVKKSLRVASDTFDDEIQALIESGKTDITQATDKAFDITDSVECNAIAVYCQAYFGYGDDKALERYKDMLIHIGLRKIGDEA